MMPTVSLPLSTCLMALIPCAAVLLISVAGYFVTAGALYALILREDPPGWRGRYTLNSSVTDPRRVDAGWRLEWLINGAFSLDISDPKYKRFLLRARIYAGLFILSLIGTIIFLGLTLQDLPIGAYLTAQ